MSEVPLYLSSEQLLMSALRPRSLTRLQKEVQGYLAHKKRTSLGPYRRPMPRVLGGS